MGLAARLHEPAVALDELGHGEVEGAGRVRRGVIDADDQRVAPLALGGRRRRQRQRAARRRHQADRGGRGRGRDAHDPGLAAAVQEEVVDGVAQLAVEVQPAEAALEIREAEDLHRLVDRPAGRVADEGRDRGRHAGDGARPAGDLLDIDARIRHGDGHDIPSLVFLLGLAGRAGGRQAAAESKAPSVSRSMPSGKGIAR